MSEPAPTRSGEGQLSVNSTPAGATVQIEGQAGQWQSPQIIGPLSPGNYKVTISKPGYAPETRTVQVYAGSRASFDIRMNPVKGWITVAGSPAGASVLVDGKDTGRVTPVELMLDPAVHTLTIRKSGYLESSTDIKLAAGQSVGYSPTLMVAGRTDSIRIVGGGVGKMFNNGSQQGQARIEIKSEPKGARVIVNGTPLQKTTPVEIQVEAGNYDITLQKDGFQAAHENAIVGVDDRVKIDRALTR
jgi:hypothetical protein